MNRCRWSRDVERWFDGELGSSPLLERHLSACAACAAHVEMLRRLRDHGLQAAVREEISDAQFPAFLIGIQDRLAAPAMPRHRTVWAMASVAAAALTVATSAFILMTGRPDEVSAAHTEIESCSTELEDQTATSYSSENGTATIVVHSSRVELW